MALPYETLPGDVDRLVVDDHAVVERQFQHLEAHRGDRRALVDQVAFALALHADAEETVLYPELADAGEPDESAQAREEHQLVKELLVVLNRTEPGDPDFESALTRLIDSVRTHVAEEESVLLPRLRQLRGAARMRALGEEFLAAKRTAPSYAHPLGPSSGLGHRLLDPAAAAVDTVRDVLSGRHRHLATDPSGVLNSQAQRILDTFSALGPRPIEILTPEQARRQPTAGDAVRRILAEDGRSTAPEPVGGVRDLEIPGPAGPMQLRVYRPADAGAGPLPVVMWVHGGGWVLCDVDTYDASCRGLVNRAQAIVVAPEYRHAPEHPFPAAHDDVLAAYRWLRDNAARLGGDPGRLAIGGESVGGTMAAATCWQLKEAGEPLPCAQVLVYPLTSGEQYGESMTDAADARPLNRPTLTWMTMHAFAGVPQAVHDPRVDLLSLTPGELAGLPPTLVIVDERDVLRSQGEEFARHLELAGVPTTLRTYAGAMHEFFGAAAVLDVAAQAQQEAAEHFLRGFRGRAPQPAG